MNYSHSCPSLCRTHLNSLSAVNVWNKNAHKLVGYPPEEVMGKNLVREFITDEFKTAVQAVLDQALHGEETANFEFPLITKHGVRLDVLLNATTRRDEQGNIIGVVGIGQDVSTFWAMSYVCISKHVHDISQNEILIFICTHTYSLICLDYWAFGPRT